MRPVRVLTIQKISSTVQRFACAVVLFCGLVLAASPTRAQGPAPAPVPRGQALGMTPEIRALLNEMLAAYQKLESYEDNGRITVTQVTGRVQQSTRMPAKTIFRRPNLLHVTGGMQTMNCDGKEVQIVLEGLRQYQQFKAPAKLTMESVRQGAMGAGLDEGFPEVLEFLTGANVYARWIGQIQQIRMGKHDPPKKVEGRPVQAVYYETINRAIVTMWIDRETKLLSRYDTDYTQAQRPANSPPPAPGEALPTMEFVLQLHPVVTGGNPEKRSPSPFALRAELLAMKKVTKFSAEGAGQAPPAEAPLDLEHPLTGKPAPEILGPGVDRKTIDSTKLLSKNVGLVFFWTPVGDAGSLSSLQMMQRLNEQFLGRNPGLAILGVCAPGRDNSFIVDLLKAKKATYPVLIDADGRHMRNFSIASMPVIFLVGPDGKVQEVIEGAPHEIEAGLIKALEKMLPAVKP